MEHFVLSWSPQRTKPCFKVGETFGDVDELGGLIKLIFLDIFKENAT